MLVFPLRQTAYAAISAARVVAVRRYAATSGPKQAEAVQAAVTQQAPAEVLNAAATKSNTPKLSPSPVKSKNPAPTQGRRKPRKRRSSSTPFDPAIMTSTRRRSQISELNPKKWNRPIAEGVLPAYDEALRVIMRDSEELTVEARKLAKEIARLEAQVEAEEAKSGSEELQGMLDNLESLRKKHHVVSVQSQINLPSVRWTVANAQADSNIPAHRHLLEQRWRGQGALDLLMERIHQMHVVPDLLPGIHPSMDLHVTVPYPLNKQFKRSIKSGGKSIVGVEPGSFLYPTQTARAPGLWAHTWHLDVRLYTMVMLDPDVPDEESHSFTTYLHWLKPNIPVSALTLPRAHIPFSLLNSHTPYIPPHPQQGTPYHRYSIFLLPQPAKTEYSLNTEARFFKELQRHNEPAMKDSEALRLSDFTTHLPISTPASWPLHLLKKHSTSKWLDIPVVPDSRRRGFNLRQFTREWGLSGGDNMTLKDIGGTGLGGGTSGQSLPGLRAQVNGGKGLHEPKSDAVVVGGGVHMFREVWDESVSGLFEATFDGVEEKYTLPKKVDPYESLKGVRKYI